MRRRLTDTVVLLYPRRVRERHGPEIVALIDDLVAREGRSRTALCVRLAMDGLVQRFASIATVWAAAAILAVTSFGGLAAADLAAASARHNVSHPAHVVHPVHVAHPARSRARPGTHLGTRATPTSRSRGNVTAGLHSRR